MTGEGPSPTPAPSFSKTWKRAAAGGDLYDFGWVTSLDYFEDIYDPIELVEETWERTDVRTRWAFPSFAGCIIEDAEGEPCGQDAAAWGREQGSTKAEDWNPLCEEHRDALGPDAEVLPA